MKKDWHDFDTWLKNNGYMTYQTAYDRYVSQGYDPEKLFWEYMDLEEVFEEWCEQEHLEPTY